ncbi:STE24 endopeptidase [Sulfuritortus calidifontis]|uniref:STE24 endopeptidase n=1 Tax=Sulfuritortus calidifontis TaxID=1914471 RepID=A0A4R3JUW4_9PROT|nr:M48 family metallopeptidase [Sulfuritortus calidifontis]TCS71675.1 STE24 endopeptidase [Sulfuritortus calidifontis]
MPFFSKLFLAAVIVTFGLRIWLALRQMRHVWQHRDQPPEAFAAEITLTEHRKAADYTLAKMRTALVQLAIEMGVLLALTLGGGLQRLHDALAGRLDGPLLLGTGFLLALMALLSASELPVALYRQFRVEARFGFNRQTLAGFFGDLIKQSLLGLMLGGPLILAVLWLMAAMGELWWLYVWLTWMGFNLLMLAIYPTVIAPLFNKFTPLDDASLRSRIEGLLKRCGFAAQGVFVMDGSRRSSHGNAYFTGLGAARRIVFFDTLLKQLAPDEIEAVLAHELGHYRLKHVAKRIALLAAFSLGLLFVLAQLKAAPWFYQDLGMAVQSDAAALALFLLVSPVFLFPLTPVMSLYSRKHEFEADAYAARQADARQLVAALVKLYRDNATTLTPDPIYSLFYDSHPKATERIGRLHANNEIPAQA